MGNINLGPFNPGVPVGVEAESKENHDHHDELLTWHLLARALHRGSTGRPALPLEVILAIFRAAEIMVPNPSMTVSASRAVDKRCEDEQDSDVAETWFRTAPFTASTLQRIAAFQLHTLSYDPRVQQGKDDPASFAYYTIAIEREGHFFLDNQSVPVHEWGWASHRNLLGGDKPVHLRGPLFARDHELWEQLREGDVLVVIAVALLQGTHNIALQGSLRFWTYFEPVVL